MELNTSIIETKEDLIELIKYIDELPYGQVFAFDVETDSAEEHLANLYGVGLAFDDENAFYMPYRRPDGTMFFEPGLRNAFEGAMNRWAANHKLIGHNLIYDILVWKNNTGWDLTSRIFSDTILLKHTVDEEPPFGLKDLAVAYLGDWADMAQKDLEEDVKAKGGKWLKSQKDMYLGDTKILGHYCAVDCILTRRIFNILQAQLEKENKLELFYEDEVMPLYREVTIPMKMNGFPIDVEHFKTMQREIREDIVRLEKEIYEEIAPLITDFELQMLDKEVPVKSTGRFPKALADVLGLELPKSPSGAPTLAQGKLAKWAAEQGSDTAKWFYCFVADGVTDWLDSNTIKEAQRLAYFSKATNENKTSLFNINSKDHLAWLIVEKLGHTPEDTTETGKPKMDKEFVNSLADTYPWAEKLATYNKLIKLSSTYIDGILERQHEGKLFSSMLQFGTTSGRYSSRNPNLQNLSGVGRATGLEAKYSDGVRKGFIAPAGYKIVNSDFAQLEVRVFAHVSNEPSLQQVFFGDDDFYCAMAIQVFGLEGVSANPNHENYLKNVDPKARDRIKPISLGVVYGAEAPRVSEMLKCSKEEAQQIIDDYLDAFPNLKKYMATQNYRAKHNGFVTTMFGRTRNLKRAHDIHSMYGDDILNWQWARRYGVLDERRELKHALNNSKNFCIQGLAAHIVNRAMIWIAREFKANNIDGYIALTVHDEITCIVKEDQAEWASEIVQYCMENIVELSVPLKAEPVIAKNWAEAK
jgi:DNA polymerase I-like protein with 3'-5' exonuclease and polymerase domains